MTRLRVIAGVSVLLSLLPAADFKSRISRRRRWLAVKPRGGVTISELGRRVRVAPDFAEKLYDLASPGTTVIVTDAPALGSRPSHRTQLLMEGAR